MPTIKEIISGRSRFGRTRLLPTAHHLAFHWVQPQWSWEEGARRLREILPREARAERPMEWYASLAETHWPGRVPPGNGPFYLPEWAITSDKSRKALEGAGFRRVIAHVAHLPCDGEYLRYAMLFAGGHAFNVDPSLYRAFIYTDPKWRKRPLRAFNTKRLRFG